MRKSSIFALVTCCNILLFVLIVLHARHSQSMASGGLAERAGMVRSLKLTDLCLFTEARYTRHPAMADRFAPFQDHPSAMEHFPSGSLVSPPRMRPHEQSP